MISLSSFSSNRLPAAAAPGAPVKIRIANPDGPGELILVVDDDDFIAHLAEATLTAEGYRVVTARDGFQAVDIFKKLHASIDLVILDFVMPVMDGAAVLNEMRKINPQAPVVLTSGFTAEQSLKDLLRKGQCGFIPKPLAKTKLLMCVRSTLAATKMPAVGAAVHKAV